MKISNIDKINQLIDFQLWIRDFTTSFAILFKMDWSVRYLLSIL